MASGQPPTRRGRWFGRRPSELRTTRVTVNYGKSVSCSRMCRVVENVTPHASGLRPPRVGGRFGHQVIAGSEVFRSRQEVAALTVSRHVTNRNENPEKG